MKDKIIEQANSLLEQKARLLYETSKKEWRNSTIFLSLSFFFLLVFVSCGAILVSIPNLFNNETIGQILSPVFFGLSLFCLLLTYRFWTRAKESRKQMNEAKRLLH